VLWLVWAGKYKSSTGSAECTPCDAGKYGTTRAAVSDCTACQAGTYQDMRGASSCFACGNTTSNHDSRKECTCNEGYSGSPDGQFIWKFQGYPPFSIFWTNTDDVTVFSIDVRCPYDMFGVRRLFCGVGDSLNIRLGGQGKSSEWGNFSFASLPIKTEVLSNASGFQVVLSTDPFGGFKTFFNTSRDLYAPIQSNDELSFISNLNVRTSSSDTVITASPSQVTIALAECSACIPGDSNSHLKQQRLCEL